MTVSAAVFSYGTLLAVGNTSPTPTIYSPIAEVVTLSGPKLAADTYEVTHLLSPRAFREYIKGYVDGGEITATVNFIPADTTQQGLSESLPLKLFRVCWSDFGTSHFTFTGTSTLTTASNHGWITGQPITFSSSGTLPSPLIAGQVYFATVTGVNTITVHPTPADAVAGSSAITLSGGSGTQTVKGGSEWRFAAHCSKFTPQAGISDRLTAEITLKVTGPNSVLP